jgi:hypothetical protein
LDVLLALATGIFVSHVPQDVNDGRLEVELLTDVGTDPLSLLAAAGAGFFFGGKIVLDHSALEMVGKLLPTATAAATVGFDRRLGNFLRFDCFGRLVKKGPLLRGEFFCSRPVLASQELLQVMLQLLELGVEFVDR